MGVNIVNTLADVSYEEAAVITPISPNSISMLLHHISFWNRVVALRAKGIKPVINDANGFDAPQLLSERDWEELKKDNILSSQELAVAIKDFDEAILDEPILPKHSSAYSNFQGQVEHVHYHLGQIVMLKN